MRSVEARMRALLRNAWLRSPMRGEALKEARRERGEYLCAHCKEIFRIKEVAVDHILPCRKLNLRVIGEFCQRLFCVSVMLQVLCKPCHKDKTKRERAA